MFLRFFFEAGVYSHIDASHCHTATCNPPLYSSTGGLPADFIHPPDVRGCQRVSPKISPASGLRKRAGEFARLSDPFRRFDVTGQLTQGARQTLAVCFRFSPYENRQDRSAPIRRGAGPPLPRFAANVPTTTMMSMSTPSLAPGGRSAPIALLYKRACKY